MQFKDLQNLFDDYFEYNKSKSRHVNELNEHADNASQLASIKTVEDMRIYLDTTGDMEGVVEKFGISEEEIDEMISYYCDLQCGRCEVQRIIDNPAEENTIAYEKYGFSYRDLPRRAAGLVDKCEYLCNIGIRPIREFLRRKYIREKDIDARIYQLAMDVEEKSIMVKKSDYLDHNVPYEEQEMYKAKMEEQKSKLLRKLIQCYKDAGYEYGWRTGYRDDFTYYVYFDLPNGEQISFRTDLSEKEKEEIPRYTKKWNCWARHTLEAIENNLLMKYPNLKDVTSRQPKGLIETCSPEMLAIIYGEYDPTSGQMVLDDKLRKKFGV